MSAAHLIKSAPPALVDRQLIEVASESLWQFVRMSFDHIGVGGSFIDGKHIHVICEHLEAASNGEIKELCINIPPGYMKSLLVCVFWPTWDWIRNPQRKFLFGSYDKGLARRDASRQLRILQSQWFINRWGRYILQRRPAEGHYVNRWGGERYSTSVDGAVLGRHYNVHVCDDPIKAKDANNARPSKLMLSKAERWWNETISTRVFDRKTLIRCIIMQRLHVDDLAGIAERAGYYMLKLPLEYDPQISTPDVDWRKHKGELLWPEKDGPSEVEKAKKDLSTQAAIASQLQQKPVPMGGLVFKEEWFRYWHYDKGMKAPNGTDCVQLPLRGGRWAQSWDLTFKGSDGSDRVAWGVLWQHRANYFLMAWDAQVMSYTETKKAFTRVTKRWPKAMLKLVENKANGPALENDMKADIPGIRLVEPDGGKMSRALNAQPVFESGNFLFPHPDICKEQGLDFDDIRQELTNFPFASHDDLVDMISQGVNNLSGRYMRMKNAMQKVRNNQ